MEDQYRARVYQPTTQEIQDAKGLIMVNGIIQKEEIDDSGTKRVRTVVPLSLQRRVIEEAHNKSHAGVRGTTAEVSLYHWFRGMKIRVKEVVKQCEIWGRPRRMGW